MEASLGLVVGALGESLRRRGYAGRKGRWHRRDKSGNVVLVAVQRSGSSTASAIRFTVNVAVVNRTVWEWELEDLADERKPDVWSAHWRERPSADDGGARWWTVDESSDAERLTADVVARVVPVCATAEQLLDTPHLVDLWQSGRSPGLTAVQRRQYLGALAASSSRGRQRWGSSAPSSVDDP